MKKVLTILLILTVMLSISTVGALKWKYEKVFWTGSMPHGVMVTPDNKVWIGPYGYTDTISTIPLVRTSPVSIYNMDGTLVTKLHILTFGTYTDTLVGCRGVQLDKDGNVLWVDGRKVFRINYKTHAVMNRYYFSPGSATNACEASGVPERYVFVGPVLNGLPIVLLGADFTAITNAVDTTYQIARNLACWPDGKHVFLGSTTGPGVIKYSTDLVPLGPWVPTDTLAKGYAVESLTWRKGLLWMSAWNNGDGFVKDTWYAWDFTKKQFTDSIKFDSTTIKVMHPRGIGFTTKGDTAFIAGFDGGAVLMYSRQGPDGVDHVSKEVPAGYELMQNYPNPFNPSTVINFSLPVSGFVSLKVYDMMGREVSTLINTNMERGAYTATFDGKHLASGAYVYVLTSGNTRIAKKMMLMK
jgi:hypothetical protein